MHLEQRQKTHELLKQHKIQQALFARTESVKWLTGFAPPVQVGQNLFASGNPLLWYDDGQYTLIIVDSFRELAVPYVKSPDLRIIPYVGYSLSEPINSARNLLSILKQYVKVRGDKIGIEREYVSDLVSEYLREKEIVPVDGLLESLRMIKTDEELARLRRNFAFTDVGHAAARAAVAVGKREIDIWDAAHTAIQAAAGRRVPLGNDCVIGRRVVNIGGWPENLEMQEHDSIIVDLSAIDEGYWSDSCATYYAGERTEMQQKIHRVVTDALEFGISLVRPGVVCKDIDQKIRQFIADAGYPVYPHHTGHGVGVSGHEAPRIVPYSEEVLQPGMVIMLEPGIYFPGQTGVRLEDGLLVTSDGAEILTKHDKS
jgi:Xaa-Pro dipeptidase